MSLVKRKLKHWNEYITLLRQVYKIKLMISFPSIIYEIFLLCLQIVHGLLRDVNLVRQLGGGNAIASTEEEWNLLELKLSHATELKELESSLKKRTWKSKGTSSVKYATNKKHRSEISILRHEHKSSGQVGQLKKLAKITYVALTNQMNNDIKQGFLENGIADALIKAISPHSSVRNYILTISGLAVLNMPQLKTLYQKSQF